MKIRLLLLAALHWVAVTEPSAQTAGSWADQALGEASWIWQSEGGVLGHLRRTFEISGEVSEAEVLVTADNGYELYVNGSFIGSDIGADAAIWRSVERYDVKSLLRAGKNAVAVRASDLGGQAGFLAAIRFVEQGGEAKIIVSDGEWLATPNNDPTGFAESNYQPDASWKKAAVIGKNGCAPWGKVDTGGPRSPNLLASGGNGIKAPGADFDFPERILMVRGRVPESSTAGSPQAIWRIGNSRAYLELDTLGPSMIGRTLQILKRGEAGKEKYSEQVLFDAKGGLVGSPAISHDGQTVYFSHVPTGEKFWRIYKMPIGGGKAEGLTSGPFHDFDPEPLPDGRIVFSSTRIGNREEYHGNMARSIYVMKGDGSGIRAITHHIVGDMEPKLTATGNIVFVRQDNFFERAKVETHIHSVRPDGTAGHVLLGPDRKGLAYNVENAAEENGLWLRNYGFGSPAPLPDGRVAALSSFGMVISGNAVLPERVLRPAVELIDISPLPDGRLLCTLAGQSGVAVFDIEKNEITRIYSKGPFDLHSAIFVGARSAPVIGRSSVPEEAENISKPTGFLLAQSVYISKQQNVDLSRIRAVRVIEGRPFALRSARHPYDHLGVESIELGTVPVAADGSFYVEVPADRALSIQAVDGEGRSVVNELSWIYVRPGEQRSCVGCHSQREAAPPNGGILALRSEAVKLLGEGDPVRWRGNNAANGGVLNLQVERMREAGGINTHEATDGAAVRNRAELVDGLMALMANGRAEERISAAQRLALLRDKRSASALAAALRAEEKEVRLNAALALAACGTSESTGALLQALEDSAPVVAQAAHVALRTITGEAVAFDGFGKGREGLGSWKQFFAETNWAERQEKKLIERVKAGQAREDDFTALGRIGGKGAIPELTKHLAASKGKNLTVLLAAIRALGQIGDSGSVPALSAMLNEQSKRQTGPAAGDHEFGWTQRPVQLAAAAAEALGRIGGAEAEEALLQGFSGLAEFWYYTFATADHDWLMGSHSSVVHFRILEALDAIGSEKTASIVPQILRSIPIDTDRGLLFENDSYETVAMRLVARSGLREAVVAACFEVLSGKTNSTDHLVKAVTDSPPAVSVGPLCVESRAAQILSVVGGRKEELAPLQKVFERYRAQEPSRTRSWTAFFLARLVGKVGEEEGAQSLIAALQSDAREADLGLLDPPNVFVYEAMTPFYRAAAADALGRIGAKGSGTVLLKELGNFQNAVDVRQAAAGALTRVLEPGMHEEASRLAASYPESSTKRLLLQACERRASPTKQLARQP